MADEKCKPIPNQLSLPKPGKPKKVTVKEAKKDSEEKRYLDDEVKKQFYRQKRMLNWFQRLRYEAHNIARLPHRQKKSAMWFKNRCAKISYGEINRKTLHGHKDLLRRKTHLYGTMMLFVYDAKWKKKLPYWDKFPLVIMLGKAKGGFYGLNVHYLPPILRVTFLEALWKHAPKVKRAVIQEPSRRRTRRHQLGLAPTKKSKSAITGELVRVSQLQAFLATIHKMKLFQPMIHHYLLNHVQSDFVLVAEDEWEPAVFLPLADWDSKSSHGKPTPAKVYKDSRKKMKK